MYYLFLFIEIVSVCINYDVYFTLGLPIRKYPKQLHVQCERF